MLEKPEEFYGASVGSNRNLIRRQFDRILRFARTLKNKGRLNFQMEKILKI
jgi:hypothetical protein